MFTLNHLVICTADLDTGSEEMEALLGVPFEDGGFNATHATRSKVLSLGPDEYLEIIAVDKEASPPRRPRWYALDQFSGNTRLTNWVVRTNELSHLISLGAAGPGTPMASSRNGLRWTMVVPDDGELPLDGAAPALIEWRGGKHPAQILPDRKLRLQKLKLCHPDVDRASLPDDPRIEVAKAPFAMSAVLETPMGLIEI